MQVLFMNVEIKEAAVCWPLLDMDSEFQLSGSRSSNSFSPLLDE